MGCDLDVNSRLTNFYVQNIDDKIETVVEKKVNQTKKEWGKCFKKMPVFTIREIENHRIKSGKSSSALEVGINKVNCNIIFEKCSCPTGESG